MYKLLKKAMKWTLLISGTIVGCLLLYLLAAWCLGAIACNRSFKQSSGGVELFLKSNGVHTDLVLPVHHPLYNWKMMLDTTAYRKENKPFEYLSVGWGDKGFYLDTPTWADLKFSTAFMAMFWPTPTAMHITYLTQKPVLNELTRKVTISNEQYGKLIAYIQNSFDKNPEGKVYLINCCHYAGVNDNFYEAKGSYHLFFTCNSWANDALKKSGIRTSYWTPFDKSILGHFE